MRGNRVQGVVLSTVDQVRIRRVALASTALALMTCVCAAAQAETISGALAKAYMNNPTLNAQRAGTRAVDENVSRSMSGFRPTVTATGDAGLQFNETWRPATGNTPGSTTRTDTMPRGVGLTVQQNIFNGNRTVNGVRQAESQVLQSREQLRSVEQSVLANGAVAYMNVLRDTAISNLRSNNVRVLEQQLKQTQDRFQVGEVTRTDVAQAEAALAIGRSDAFVAQSNLANSLAVYRQIIGEQPKSLSPAQPLSALLPKTVKAATELALKEHPDVVAALHAADVASLAVKISEGALYPTANLTGNVQKRYDNLNVPDSRVATASIVGQLNIPIYDGGLSYANIRQAKETHGQARMQVEVQRETVRAAVVSSWGTFENAARVIQAQQSAVRAAEIALEGVREEAKVGQRTTLDVLNAQQALLNARVQLVTAQRDRVVNSYALMLSVGQLLAEKLRLKVTPYDPVVHFDQVKGKWWGARTPDGR